MDAPSLPPPRILQAGPCLVSKGPRQGKVTAFGIYDATGYPLAGTEVEGVKYRTRPLPRLDGAGDAAGDGPDEIFYGGQATDQFGFTILNSIGRLWAIDRVAPTTPILYHSDLRPRRIRYLRPVLDMLGVTNPVLLYDRPLRVGRAVVASDQFGEMLNGWAGAPFRTWLSDRLAPSAPPQSGRKLYLTRSALPSSMGRFAGERVLEENLAAAGYEIVAPETLSLTAQIALYQSAGTLLFSESSALHLFALVRRPGQTCGIVSRRRQIPPLIHNQLAAFAPDPVHVVDAIEAVFHPPSTQDNSSIARLDFDRLRTALIDIGFLKARDTWRNPDADTLETDLRAGLQAGQELIPEALYPRFLQEVRLLRRKHGRAAARKLIPRIRLEQDP